MLNSIKVAPGVIEPVTKTLSWVFEVSIFVVKTQLIDPILAIAAQVGAPEAKIDKGELLLGSHLGRMM